MSVKSFLLALALSTAAVTGALAQECVTPDKVTEMLTEGAPDDYVATYVDLSDKRKDWFLTAYTKVTGNPVPDMDQLRVYMAGSAAVLVGFKEGCAVGSARIPFPLYVQIKAESEQNRAEAE